MFALYTAARLVLFAAAFGLIWLVFGHWLSWDATSALYTAIIALVVSSVVALFALQGLRGRFAEDVSQRADRMRDAFEARRAAEDREQPADGDQGARGIVGDDRAAEGDR